MAFLALAYAYITSDFSVENVWANSHSLKPLIYRIAGVWGNHEGSMLLWVLILALFGAAVALFGGNLPATLRANVLSVQAGIGVAFLAFIVFASNPFVRIPLQAEGRGLNPVLQDPALAFHPPFLYAGYVGLSMAFSFAIAALIEGRTDAAWARWVRPWTLGAWACLTLGIAMGSWWAYYELGWGGWWFWDPVENASFMPWLAATALLHSALVMEKREALRVWTVLLAILAFSLSLMGTFLVRSGILTSVHAFAVDPTRGIFILAILVVLIGGALALYAWRAPTLQQGGLFAPISREGALVLNNVLLTVALRHRPRRHALSSGAGIAHRRQDLRRAALLQSHFRAAHGSAAPCHADRALPRLEARRSRWCAPASLRRRRRRAGGPRRHRRDLLARTLACTVRHRARCVGRRRRAGGMGQPHKVVLRAVGRQSAPRPRSAARGLRRHARPRRRRPRGDRHRRHHRLAERGSDVHEARRSAARSPAMPSPFAARPRARAPTTRSRSGQLTVTGRGAPVAQLEPSKRTYDAPRQTTTEAAIHIAWLGDLYAVLGDELADGGFVVRLYFNPLVRLIWLGALVMAFGGVLSLTDRRLRIGAPRRARRKDGPKPGARRMTRVPHALRHPRVMPEARKGKGGDLRHLFMLAFAFLILAGAACPASAVEPGEMLKDPALEARARKISQELRCVVCQNQSIDDSNAPLAHDLRVLVRERIAAGDSDSQVLAFVEARYGEFVLLRPRFKPQTMLLWLTPLLLLAGAGVFLLRARRRLPAAAAPALSADEQRRLEALLARDHPPDR